LIEKIKLKDISGEVASELILSTHKQCWKLLLEGKNFIQHKSLIEYADFLFDLQLMNLMRVEHPPHIASLNKILLSFCEMNDRFPYFLRLAFEKLIALFLQDFTYLSDFKESFVEIACSREIRGYESYLRISTPLSTQLVQEMSPETLIYFSRNGTLIRCASLILLDKIYYALLERPD
jgi:hypothetical protein